jgi:hypothetical protein
VRNVLNTLHARFACPLHFPCSFILVDSACLTQYTICLSDLLISAASGTCHALSDKKGIDSAHCDHGQWVTLNALMLSSLLLLLICSYADWARRRKESEGASASGLGSRSGSIEIAERARLTADNNAGDGRDYGSRQSEPSLEF